jgi:hypothetical protein
MNIENIMEESLPELRKLLKKNNFSIEPDAIYGWRVKYTYPNGPDEFFGPTREFTLPHFMRSENERVAILYTLRRFVNN